MEILNPELKFDVLERFLRLQNIGRAALRLLQVKDCVDLAHLYKKLGSKIYGRKGIKSFRLVDNQIILPLVNGDRLVEIEEQEQLDEIIAQLQQASCSKP